MNEKNKTTRRAVTAAAGVAATLLLGAEVLLRGAVVTAAHDPEALRGVRAGAREVGPKVVHEVRYEVPEETFTRAVVRSCRAAVVDRDDPVANARCAHRVVSEEPQAPALRPQLP